MYTLRCCKHACLAVLCLLLSQSGWSQYHFGVKAGTALSRYVTSDIVALGYYDGVRKARVGLLGGFFAEWRPENKRLGVRTELLYLEQGEKGTYIYFDGTITDIDFRRQYLAIPMLLSYQWGALALDLGPQPSIQLNSDFKAGSQDRQGYAFEDDILFELAAQAGLRFVHKHWEVGLTYNRGLLNLLRNYNYTDENGVVIDDQALTQYNESLLVSVGYRFSK